MANIMGDKRNSAVPKIPFGYARGQKGGPDVLGSQITPESSGLFSKSIGFLNNKLGILQGDSRVPTTMPKNSRAKMPQGDINKKARDAIIDQQILNGMLDLVINID